jgi:phosphoserine phosphatase RsbU/P
LPQSDPVSPWLDIAGLSRPATEVGGDYYDYFELDDDGQAVVVADVAGHGVASGLLLAGVRGCLVMLHHYPNVAAMPAEILGRLDWVVRAVGGRRTFVTMIYAIFQRSTSRLRLASAGHPPILLWRQATGDIEELILPSLPLGTTLAPSFPEQEVALAVGDVAVLLTDGLAEALDPQGAIFGDAGLRAALGRAAASAASASAIRDALLAEVVDFLGANEGQDDMTLVVVRIKACEPR